MIPPEARRLATEAWFLRRPVFVGGARNGNDLTILAAPQREFACAFVAEPEQFPASALLRRLGVVARAGSNIELKQPAMAEVFKFGLAHRVGAFGKHGTGS